MKRSSPAVQKGRRGQRTTPTSGVPFSLVRHVDALRHIYARLHDEAACDVNGRSGSQECTAIHLLTEPRTPRPRSEAMSASSSCSSPEGRSTPGPMPRWWSTPCTWPSRTVAPPRVGSCTPTTEPNSPHESSDSGSARARSEWLLSPTICVVAAPLLCGIRLWMRTVRCRRAAESSSGEWP